MDASWLFPIVGALGPAANAVGAWLLTYAVHSTVILVAAWAIASIRPLRWAPAARHGIWGVAMLAGFVTATAQIVSPRPSAGGALQLAESARRAVAAVQVLQQSVPPAGGVTAAGDTDVRLMVFAISPTTMVVGAWSLIAAALLAQLAVSHRQLERRLATRRVAGDTLAAGALRHLAGIAGVRRPVVISTSDALQAPAAISDDEIVLPTRLLRELTLAEQEGVIAHELAHVVRADTRWLQLAAIVERVAWFQPLNRLARREMQLSAEFAADAWAVRVTREPVVLARALARIATWIVHDPRPTVAFVSRADGSPLVERVRRLTSPTPLHAGRGRPLAYSTMLVATAGALMLLPRVDVTHRGPLLQHRMERVEVRVARGAGDARTGAAAMTRRELPPAFAFASKRGGTGVDARARSTSVRIVRISREDVRVRPTPRDDAVPSERVVGEGAAAGSGGAAQSWRPRVVVLARKIS